MRLYPGSLVSAMGVNDSRSGLPMLAAPRFRWTLIRHWQPASCGRLLRMSNPVVSEPVVTAAATILGTIVGAVASYASQRAQWNRQYDSRWDESKKNAYAALFTACNQWWRAIHWYWDTVEDIRNRYIEMTGEISILAEGPTRQAATNLAGDMGDLQAKFVNGQWPSDYDVDHERDNFVIHREAYRDAVRRELFAAPRHTAGKSLSRRAQKRDIDAEVSIRWDGH